jgi:hypothetical protein
MNLLDENINASQRELLRAWGVAVRQIGHDFGAAGSDDEQIIPILHRERRATFFTRDLGFYNRSLCHSRYCLVCLAVLQTEAAIYIRRVLAHPEFSTQTKRKGCVLRVSPIGLRVWRLSAPREARIDWPTHN